MDIAVIGSNMVDLITYINQMPKLGETLEADDFAMGCGGKGANQAVAAARLGAEVMMLSKVGDDLFADKTLTNLKRYGINTHHVHKVPGVSSGVAPIFVDRDSHNRILIVPGANKSLSPDDIDNAAEELLNCKMIVLQLEIPLNTVYHAIDFAHAAQIPVILNPAPANIELDLNYACRCDYFIPNESELELLTGRPVHSLDEVHAAANQLLDHGLKHLIVTLGSRGALYVTHNNHYQAVAPVVDAVDTTGAGDAFIGCFAQSVVSGLNTIEAIDRAVGYSALSVTRRGTQSSYVTSSDFSP